MQLPFLLPQLQLGHEKRVANYQKQFEALTTALRKPADTPVAEETRKPVRIAAEAAVDRLTKEKNWWAWQLKADAESDPIKQEAIYRAGLEDFPQGHELLGNFANFMTHVRKDYDEAERLYRKALELDPAGAIKKSNFAQFLFAKNRFDEARDFAIEAWVLLDETPSDNHAEVAFTRWLLDRAARREGGPALGRLKALFQTGFRRSSWSFDDLLANLAPLAVGEHALARRLAEAIIDDNKVGALDEESIWRAIDPIDLDLPWPS
jgi:tetratricopeptide (TPR) repeat protein